MLVKERTLSLKIKKLEVLRRRLFSSHPKLPSVEEELAKSNAGFNGEQSLDYHLKLLQTKDLLIFHDLRIPINNTFFQIDTLLLSSRYLLILEVKNISGTLIFDHLNQLIRLNSDGKEEAFLNPIVQVKRQQALLIEWLRQNRMPQIPVQSLVLISSPKTIIKAPPTNKEVLQKIIHSEYLKERVDMFEKLHKDEKLSKKELKKLSKLLIHHHTPSNPDILKRFQIEEKDIMKGVYCIKCSSISVIRKRGTWHCTKCSYKSNDLHLYSLNDYVLLFGTSITNNQFCDFLNLPSRHVAKRLLNTMNLKQIGAKKGRIYLLSEPK